MLGIRAYVLRGSWAGVRLLRKLFKTMPGRGQTRMLQILVPYLYGNCIAVSPSLKHEQTVLCCR